MEVLGGLFVWIIIIALIVGAINKNKEEKAQAEEIAKQEQAIKEEEKKKEIELLKMQWEEKKEEYLFNGLPSIEVETLKLTKNEICHFMGDASFCKLKQQTVGYEGGSRGVSIRVAKGLSFRVGNYQGKYIKEQISEKTNGIIYLTSKKIIFTAPSNSRVIKYKDIINLNVFENMLQIQTDERAYLYQIEDSFNFMLILEILLDSNEEKSTSN